MLLLLPAILVLELDSNRLRDDAPATVHVEIRALLSLLRRAVRCKGVELGAPELVVTPNALSCLLLHHHAKLLKVVLLLNISLDLVAATENILLIVCIQITLILQLGQRR